MLNIGWVIQMELLFKLLVKRFIINALKFIITLITSQKVAGCGVEKKIFIISIHMELNAMNQHNLYVW